MSRDPLAGKAKDPASLHKYLYANGDPVNAMDPTGKGTLLEAAGLTAQALVLGLQIGCGAVTIIDSAVYISTGHAAFADPIKRPCQAVSAATVAEAWAAALATEFGLSLFGWPI